MNKKQIVKYLVIVSVVIGICLSTLLNLFAQPNEGVKALPPSIVKALSDYSNYLATNNTESIWSYTSEINCLVEERRNFYKELCDLALMINFVGLKSEYLTTSGFTAKQKGNSTHIEITEIVTIYAKSMVLDVEDYPLVQSARWALGHTDNEMIKRALDRYLQAMIESVNESITNGITLNYVLRHKLHIVVDNDQAMIVQDSFDDKSIENVEGTDVAIWKENGFKRIKPDWTRWPDYEFFNTPIDVLGKNLLDHYTSIAGQSSEYTLAAYNHTSGKNYINTYTSNTTLTCPGGSALQDATKYNPSYSYFNCVDCVNYVSQAINYGGFTRDTTWKPYTNAWVNTVGLKNYLVSLNRIAFKSSLSYLIPGDLAWTTDWGHVVMYSATNPSRYSGHTNDRLNYAWASSLTNYGDIW